MGHTNQFVVRLAHELKPVHQEKNVNKGFIIQDWYTTIGGPWKKSLPKCDHGKLVFC